MVADPMSSQEGSRPRWPVAAAVAIAVYLALTAVLVWLGMRQTGGTFVYAQDDPYIHLTLARTLARFGVWGIRPDAFAGASSSPLWTVLLAALQRAGAVAVWWPLVLNLMGGTGLLLVVSRILEREGLHRLQLPMLLAIVLVTPLPTLAVIGLEHTLFILLAVAFCWRVAIEASNQGTDRSVATSLLAAALVATRYEGLFLIAAAVGLLLLRRRPLVAVQLAIAASVPVVAYAAYSLAHGGPVLPNSVLMKSGPSRFVSVGAGVAAVLADWFAIVQLFNRPPQLVLTLAVLLALALTWETHGGAGARRSGAMALLFVTTSLLHACLVKMEWFFRYEAYLIALGLMAVGLVAGPSAIALMSGSRKRLNAAASALVVLLAIPLAVRALSALAVTSGAMRNVYQQQYQMAMFFRDAYPRDAIALNDIGAVSWLAPSPIVDVMGLATSEVADLKRRRQFNRDTLAALVAGKNVKAIAMFFRDAYPRDAIALNDIGAVSWMAPSPIVDVMGLATSEVADLKRRRQFNRDTLAALVAGKNVKAIAMYERVFAPVIPPSWQLVAEWRIRQNVGVSEDTVGFFAPTAADAARLRLALEAFSTRLPAAVQYRPHLDAKTDSALREPGGQALKF